MPRPPLRMNTPLYPSSRAFLLMALMAQDKKVKRGRLTFILLQAIGRAVVANDVEPALVRGFLQQKLSG